MEICGVQALQAASIDVHSGQQVMEHARVIKGVDEVHAMRCAIATCEIAMAEMEAAMEPGMTEVEIWTRLHAGNIKRGGEWLKCAY